MAETKTITATELAKHKESSDCWIAIDGKVYAVPEDFLDEHPGGDEVIMAEAGKDATEAFEEVGHSDDARGLLEPMLVGMLEATSSGSGQSKSIGKERVTQTPLLMFIPIAVYAGYLAFQHFLEQQKLHL